MWSCRTRLADVLAVVVHEPPTWLGLSSGGVGPGAAVGSRRSERGGSSQGEGGVNLRDGGPDSRAFLPLSLPEVAASLCREFLGLAVVIWARHRSSRWARCPALESYQPYRAAVQQPRCARAILSCH